MTTDQSTNSGDASGRGATLGDVAAIVRRRWWVLALCAIAFPAAAYAYSNSQPKLYRAEAQVLLSRQSLANSLTGTPDPDLQADRDRLAQTQIEIAQLPVIADRALRSLKLKDRTPGELLETVEVSSLGKTDILVIAVEDSNPGQSVALANAYATQYTVHRARLDTASISRTLREVNERLKRLDSEDKSDLYKNLEDKQQQLRTLLTLQTSNSIVVRRADSAAQVQPQPRRDAALGLIFGLIVGGALLLAIEALDSRLRTPQQQANLLGLNLLGRVPPDPARPGGSGIVLIDDPRHAAADAYRRVFGAVEAASIEQPARKIITLSATDDDLRSELIANLAVAFARAGRRAVLVDADPQRARLSEILHVADRPGLSEVVSDSLTLDQVRVPVRLPGEAAQNGNENGDGRAANGNGSVDRAPSFGRLSIVPAGALPPETTDVAGSAELGAALDALAADHDVVLIDAPAVLRSADAARIARHADGAIVVARAGLQRRDAAIECGRLFAQVPAPAFGFVSTDDEAAAELASRLRADRAPTRTVAPPVTIA